MVPFSVLDLATITDGSDAATALRHTRDLAQHAERWGYRRYWVAEHHNMPGIASAATAIVIAHVAAGTRTIRVGAGGIMLPNHAPLVVAEQFGTLESLFPGRIDLGLGRAPGSDLATARALRRTLASDPDAFPQDILELLSYFEPRGEDDPPGTVRAVPGAGLKVPLYILGSSLFGAQVAAALGLPFAFASHFAASLMLQAIEIYRRHFRPSADHPEPYLMLGVNIVAADTDEEARFIATSGRQSFANLRRGLPTTLPPPSREFEREVVPFGTIPLAEVQSVSMVGAPVTVRQGLEAFVDRTRPDELIIAAQIFDHAARLRSYEIVGKSR
ncbi:MAG: LLM class flavin-dependent oxidoreductase [Acidobacteria bacterium]|nr:LLM class flavin-dependent oxidoreductase [Acidobacteriota bacterium]